jgi:hypothetical protein
MRERLVTLACAFGALALFYVMFIGTGARRSSDGEVARPVASERRGNGYFAAGEWLERSGVRVVSLRERYAALTGTELEVPGQGNALLVTLPGAQGFQTEELLHLDRWVRRGNTLIVMAALFDRPDWALASGGGFTDDLLALTGLGLESAESRERRLRGEFMMPPSSGRRAESPDAAAATLRKLHEPRALTFEPARPHAYFDGVRRAEALTDYPASEWSARVPYDAFVLTLARLEPGGEGVLWTRSLGAGRIIVSALGTPFTNRALGRRDNARLLANLVAANVAPEGAVLFDDLRQGVSAAYDPARFYADRRLHLTIGILVALWLAWVLGSTRLRAVRTATTAPRETDLLYAAGGFFARVVPVHAAAQRLYQHFFDGVRARLGLPRNGEATWEWLERHPRLAAGDLERLKAGYAAAHSEQRVDLGAVHQLLLQIERRIA